MAFLLNSQAQGVSVKDE